MSRMKEPLSDGFVLLRCYQEGDVNEVYEAVRESIADLSPWFAWCDRGYSMETTRSFLRDRTEWWEKGEVHNFAITDHEKRAYCGGCLLNNINLDNRFANMAYWVRSSRRGGGIAPASARLVASYGFERLGLNRVEIVVAVDNIASIRVAEKADAKREGSCGTGYKSETTHMMR